jgi:hypothetical protein
MANFGFSTSPTPALIFKVIGGKEWTNQQRLDCYIAAASGELPDNVANAKFISTLNTLGIAQAESVQVLGKKVQVDVYNADGKRMATLSDDDKRKAAAAVLFKGQDAEKTYVMLSGVVGADLDTLYQTQCKPTDDLPFSMYRLRIGTYVIYRVTNETISPESLARQGVKYLVDTKKVAEKDWASTLIS